MELGTLVKLISQGICFRLTRNIPRTDLALIRNWTVAECHRSGAGCYTKRLRVRWVKGGMLLFSTRNIFSDAIAKMIEKMFRVRLSWLASGRNVPRDIINTLESRMLSKLRWQ